MPSAALALTIRLMDATDIHRGFLDTVKALKPVELTAPQAVEIYQHRLKSRIRTFIAEVDNRIVGTASVFIEPKFIHSGGIVGHIEDVAVHAGYQNRGVGRALIAYLIEECRRLHCYKVILDCADEIIPFYEKLGFRRWESTVRFDLKDSSPNSKSALG